MRVFFRGLLFFAALTSICVPAAETQGCGQTPPAGFVPDKTVAIKIGEAVLIPIYGEGKIRSEEPFVAGLEGDVWTVSGTLPKNTMGGVAYVKLSRADGRILDWCHFK